MFRELVKDYVPGFNNSQTQLPNMVSPDPFFGNQRGWVELTLVISDTAGNVCLHQPAKAYPIKVEGDTGLRSSILQPCPADSSNPARS